MSFACQGIYLSDVSIEATLKNHVTNRGTVSLSIFQKAKDISVAKRKGLNHQFPLKRFIGSKLYPNIHYVGYWTSNGHYNKKIYCYYGICRLKTVIAKESLQYFHKLFINFLQEVTCKIEPQDYLSRCFDQTHSLIILMIRKLKEDLKALIIFVKTQQPIEAAYVQKRIKETRKRLKIWVLLNDKIRFISVGCNLVSGAAKIWEQSDYDTRREIQFLIFPKGIEFDSLGRKLTYVHKLGDLN